MWRNGAFALIPATAQAAHHHLLDHAENRLLRGERHLQIQLREFRLPVGAQILVAEAARNLEVAVQPADHQNLFEDLRRLRQRVKLPVMHAAGHQVIARALRRRARQHRRLDFVEAQRVQRLADFQNHAVAQRQIALRARPPQIEIAVAQPRLFAGVDFVFHHERRRLRRVQNAQFARRTLPLRRWPDRDSASAARATRPRTATTYSERNSSARACAAGASSLLNTICAIPPRSRRSMKIRLPRSRRRCTQPISTTSLSASAARKSPA